MKPFTKLAAVFFGLAALIHVVRIFYPFRIMIGRNMVPYSASFVAVALGLVLCVGLWKESNK